MRSREIEWSDEPTMDVHETEQLRPLIERWKIEHLWGQPRRIKPRLVTDVFGDGRRLLCLYPLMYRPNHFVVRMDSTVEIRHAGDWLDEIYEAIETEFYEWPWARAYGLRWHANEGAENDSRLSFEDGSVWDEMRWPRLKRRLPRQAAA